MIIPSLGKMCVGQTIASAQTDDSDNVIQIAAVDYAAMTDVWWNVITNTVATGDASDTYKFQLVLATAANLTTNIEVLSKTVTDFESKVLVTAGRNIVAVNLGKTLKEMLEDDGSTYPFIGMIITISSGAQIVIDAQLGFTEPHTIPHRMQVVSNIDNSIAVASAGSGA